MAGMTKSDVRGIIQFRELLGRVEGDPFWRHYLDALTSGWWNAFSLHLAVLVDPYLDFILSGKKTIESRFSLKRCPPYERVHPGDVLLLKKVGGPVLGISRVSELLFYELDRLCLKSIQKKHADAISPADREFWKDREKASFATLIWLENVKAIQPLAVRKRDRRGWVILTERSQQFPMGVIS